MSITNLVDLQRAADLERPQWQEAHAALVTLWRRRVISGLTLREFYIKSGYSPEQANLLVEFREAVETGDGKE